MNFKINMFNKWIPITFFVLIKKINSGITDVFTTDFLIMLKTHFSNY